MAPVTGKKVAVVGTAPSTRHMAPFGDEEWDIWACSPAVDRSARITRFFEVHDIEAERLARPDYFQFLCEATFPVHTFEDIADIPMLVRYPREEVLEAFGPKFLTSSIAWMLAFALMSAREHKVLEEVGVFGVDMCDDSEYQYQKPGCWHFCDLLEAEGVKVTIPPISDLNCHLPPYPGKSRRTGRVHQRIKETTTELNRVESTINTLRSSLDELEAQRMFYEGRLAELDYWKKNWSVQWTEY